jgi:hypothetical protein
VNIADSAIVDQGEDLELADRRRLSLALSPRHGSPFAAADLIDQPPRRCGSALAAADRVAGSIAQTELFRQRAKKLRTLAIVRLCGTMRALGDEPQELVPFTLGYALQCHGDILELLNGSVSADGFVIGQCEERDQIDDNL